MLVIARYDPYAVFRSSMLAARRRRAERDRRRAEMLIREGKRFAEKWREAIRQGGPKDVTKHKVTSLQVLAAKKIVKEGSVFCRKLEESKILPKVCMQIVWEASIERPKCQKNCCYRD